MYTQFSIQHIGNITAEGYLDLPSTPVIITFASSDSMDADGVKSRSEIILHFANHALAAALVKAINAAVAECEEPLPNMPCEEFNDVNQF